MSLLKISIFFIISILTAVLFNPSENTNGYNLEGNLIAPNGTKVKISYHHNSTDVQDSASVQDNYFSIRKVLPENVVCTLSNSLNRQIKILLMENSNIQLAGEISKFYNLSIKGATENDLYESFKTKKGLIYVKYRSEVEKKHGDLKDKLSVDYLASRRALDSLTMNFVKKYPSSTAACLAITDSYIYDKTVDQAQLCYNLLSNSSKSSIYGRRIKQFIDAPKIVMSGRKAPDFQLKDSNGQMQSLSGFKGRYVLLDFWASWCGPCREEHPELVSLYKKYSDRIQFISLSMDASEKSWQLAVKQDNLAWLQLIDPRSINGDVADSYGIKSIPFNCVVDPTGKIVATKLRGNDLKLFLEQLPHITK